VDLLSFFGDAVNLGVIVAVLGIVEAIKATVKRAGKAVPSVVWPWVALALGALAALVVPLDVAEPTWRHWAQAALLYGGAALVLFAVAEKPLKALVARFADPAPEGKGGSEPR